MMLVIIVLTFHYANCQSGLSVHTVKTDTIHKGVCDGKVSLKILVEISEVRGLLLDRDLDIRIILKWVSNIVGWCGMSISGI
jgi:hypothetical protein